MDASANVTKLSGRLGDTCSTDDDCADATAVHSAAECSYSGECSCREHIGFGGADCASLTVSSFAPIIVQAVLSLEYLIVLAMASQALARVCRTSRHGFKLTTGCCTWLAAFLLAVFQIENLAYVSRGVPFGTHSYIQDGLIAASGTFTILSALNVSLMWIEFVMASEQMKDVSSNLELTRSFLLGYIGSFLGVAVLGIGLTHAFDNNVGWFLLTGSCLVSALLIMATFTVGARRMSAVYLRAAVDLKTSIVSRTRQLALFNSTNRTSRPSRGDHSRVSRVSRFSRFSRTDDTRVSRGDDDSRCSRGDESTRASGDDSRGDEVVPFQREERSSGAAKPRAEQRSETAEEEQSKAERRAERRAERAAEREERVAQREESLAQIDRDSVRQRHLEERARLIVTKARDVTRGFGVYVVFTLLYHVAVVLMLGPYAVWPCVLVFFTAMAAAIGAIAQFLVASNAPPSQRAQLTQVVPTS